MKKDKNKGTDLTDLQLQNLFRRVSANEEHKSFKSYFIILIYYSQVINTDYTFFGFVKNPTYIHIFIYIHKTSGSSF